MATGQYTGVNGIARKVKQRYVGVGGIARNIKTAYVGVNNVARKYFSGKKVATFTATDGTVTEYPIEVGQTIVLVDSGTLKTDIPFDYRLLVLSSGGAGNAGQSGDSWNTIAVEGAIGGAGGDGGNYYLNDTSDTTLSAGSYPVVVGQASTTTASKNHSSFRGVSSSGSGGGGMI